MKVLEIHHVQLAIPPESEEKARKFYGGLLDLQEVPKPDNLKKRGGLWFESSELRLHLGVDENFKSALKAHPAFLVEGLSNLVSKLSDSEVKLVKGQPLEGYERIYAYDPFGNRLEFLEVKKEDKQ